MDDTQPSQPQYNPKDFYTPLEEAVVEIQRRRTDAELIQKVYEYLNGDIPEHFNREQPILYLARHIATPNYEAMRFVELGKPFGLPLVISQDRKGKFVSHNDLKRALGKMPVTKGMSRRQDEIVENINVIDFPTAQGKPFNELKTKHGKDLIEFHNSFFKHIYPNDIEIVDESDWIDRNHRDNLCKQYKKMLALNIAHGVMLESFMDSELQVVQSAIGPAFEEVTRIFSLKPLISEHIDPELELTRDWNGYPSVLYQFIKSDVEGGNVCE
jgi:hypothetical protein